MDRAEYKQDFALCQHYAVGYQQRHHADGNIGWQHCQMFMRPYDFGAPYASLFERCTPRQRRLLGDLGHGEAFRPGDFFYAPEDQEALMTGAA